MRPEGYSRPPPEAAAQKAPHERGDLPSPASPPVSLGPKTEARQSARSEAPAPRAGNSVPAQAEREGGTGQGPAGPASRCELNARATALKDKAQALRARLLLLQAKCARKRVVFAELLQALGSSPFG